MRPADDPGLLSALRTTLILGPLLALIAVGTEALAQPNARTASAIEVVSQLLEVPEAQIELATAKLTIDKLIDPSIDIATSRKHLEEMVSAIRARVPAEASSRVKLEVLKVYLYQSGPWNDHRPFQYDLSDPLGRSINAKLLPTYLRTRQGNCVSMPFLFLILGERIGLDLAVSTAPEHIFLKFRDDSGAVHNIETTSGAGIMSDGWIKRQMPMTSEALANGIYLRSLSKKETVALMATTLMESYGQQGPWPGWFWSTSRRMSGRCSTSTGPIGV